MFRDKAKYGQDPNVVVRSKTRFYDPLKWSEARTIFTCSWSDFFIEEADAWRDEAFAIMALTPQHTHQVLTKRIDRALEYLNRDEAPGRIAMEAIRLRKERKIAFPNAEFNTEPLGYGNPGAEWYPLKNVWLGVSVEDQKTADERIPLLLQTPAAVRWISAEPLLGPIDLCTSDPNDEEWRSFLLDDDDFGDGLAWVVVGGESGPNARPMHPDWARSIRDQCTVAGVPFFFKQWGEWAPVIDEDGYFRSEGFGKADGAYLMSSGRWHTFSAGHQHGDVFRLGKKKAGRLLDGHEWNEMPEVSR
jgi:protein gp37